MMGTGLLCRRERGLYEMQNAEFRMQTVCILHFAFCIQSKTAFIAINPIFTMSPLCKGTGVPVGIL